jgi:hypothetical protein
VEGVAQPGEFSLPLRNPFPRDLDHRRDRDPRLIVPDLQLIVVGAVVDVPRGEGGGPVLAFGGEVDLGDRSWNDDQQIGLVRVETMHGAAWVGERATSHPADGEADAIGVPELGYPLGVAEHVDQGQ